MSIYQVGGSLRKDSSSYIQRQADTQLYNALKKGEFCYVLNSRQMGKSSLLVRTRYQLEQEGWKCATVDLTSIGSEHITPEQWYKGIVSELRRGFKLFKTFNLKEWWKTQESLSITQRLTQFIYDILFATFEQENLVIFIDEIDSILSLPFPINDFFAFIRFCYNQRALEPDYNRLTFAIFGVATPSDLIADPSRTPFNIGTAIELNGFTFSEMQPLAQELSANYLNLNRIIKRVLYWTNGQPFLSQKLFKILAQVSEEIDEKSAKLLAGNEELWVEQVVREKILDQWQSQDEPEHLKTIRDRLLDNPQHSARLLSVYQRILQGERVHNDDSWEQIELILSGLAIKEKGVLRVKTRIYEQIFNQDWVREQLNDLRPYSQMLQAWSISGQTDTSRLLRGQALQDAQVWAQGKRLSNEDYQFLSASVEVDRQAVQTALEADRTKEVEARLKQEQHLAHLQRQFLWVLSLALLIASGLGILAFWQFRQARLSEQQARISEIRALVSSSRGLLIADKKLLALVEGIKAKRRLHSLNNSSSTLNQQVDRILEQGIYEIVEANILSGNQAGIPELDFSPDGQLIATAIADHTLKLWTPEGALLKTLQGHQAPVIAVTFSPNSQILASAAMDNTLKLWTREGELLKTLTGHTNIIFGIAFSPDGQTLASACRDGTVKLWTLEGQLLKTLPHESGVRTVRFSPDGQILASGSEDRTIILWTLEGKRQATLNGHQNAITDIVFSPDGQTLASSSLDQTIKLWNLASPHPQELRTLEGHQGQIWNLRFSPQGQILASASDDRTVKIWTVEGTEIATLVGHRSRIRALDFSPDGQTLASGSADTRVKLWRLSHPLQTIFAESDRQNQTLVSQDGRQLPLLDLTETLNHWQSSPESLTGSYPHKIGVWKNEHSDGQVKTTAGQVWRRDASLRLAVAGKNDGVRKVSFSKDRQMVLPLYGSNNGTIEIQRLDGSIVSVLQGHQSIVWGTDFSPDSQLVATASSDATVKLWHVDGRLLKTLDGHQASVFDVAFSPDGEFLVSVGQDQTIRLWNLETFAVQVFQADRGLHSVDVSPDGRSIAVGTLDNAVELWDREGRRSHVLSGHEGAVTALQFSPDGQLLISRSSDRKVIVWNMDDILTANPLDLGCDWVRDYLVNSLNVEEGDRGVCG
ncbi:AAA-like domain-containing protein [Roseofilum sp. Guam]|uniref:WD40 domain-containing protein n=1 Tax=Roseofilum sp. Guam TaxID=2821502 RepID=UPI001B1BE05D|nr:AAA-like domain-containing protein [Roseofilum sp. Guam]MBP0030212.1 AAA-like domain-containing protein [Roseofilum sp. Guam]